MVRFFVRCIGFFIFLVYFFGLCFGQTVHFDVSYPSGRYTNIEESKRAEMMRLSVGSVKDEDLEFLIFRNIGTAKILTAGFGVGVIGSSDREAGKIVSGNVKIEGETLFLKFRDGFFRIKKDFVHHLCVFASVYDCGGDYAKIELIGYKLVKGEIVNLSLPSMVLKVLPAGTLGVNLSSNEVILVVAKKEDRYFALNIKSEIALKIEFYSWNSVAVDYFCDSISEKPFSSDLFIRLNNITSGNYNAFCVVKTKLGEVSIPILVRILPDE